MDWCLPKERVCDGQRDCLFDEFLQDSIDETSYCGICSLYNTIINEWIGLWMLNLLYLTEDQLTQCERMTQPKGNFSKDDEGYPRKSTFLISVKHGHVIWFTFDCLCTSAVSNAPIVKVSISFYVQYVLNRWNIQKKDYDNMIIVCFLISRDIILGVWRHGRKQSDLAVALWVQLHATSSVFSSIFQ